MSYTLLVAGRGRRKKPGWSTDAQEIVNRVFVYASLRSGQAERSMIEEYIARSEPATMEGRLFIVEDLGSFVEGDGHVVGEVVEINDLAAAFPLLDAFEGEDYARILKKATLASGEEVWAWVYMLANPELAEGAEQIESGDFVAWSAAQKA
jgi:gamma-glutamylcyclotransferase (GGCT)/AIG2-like uncharacterized protein YtfP